VLCSLNQEVPQHPNAQSEDYNFFTYYTRLQLSSPPSPKLDTQRVNMTYELLPGWKSILRELSLGGVPVALTLQDVRQIVSVVELPLRR